MIALITIILTHNFKTINYESKIFIPFNDVYFKWIYAK